MLFRSLNFQCTELVPLKERFNSIKFITELKSDQIQNKIHTEHELKELKEKIYKNVYLTFTVRDIELKNDKKNFDNSIQFIDRRLSNYLKWLVVPGLIAYGIVKFKTGGQVSIGVNIIAIGIPN